MHGMLQVKGSVSFLIVSELYLICKVQSKQGDTGVICVCYMQLCSVFISPKEDGMLLELGYAGWVSSSKKLIAQDREAYLLITFWAALINILRV